MTLWDRFFTRWWFITTWWQSLTSTGRQVRVVAYVDIVFLLAHQRQALEAAGELYGSLQEVGIEVNQAESMVFCPCGGGCNPRVNSVRVDAVKLGVKGNLLLLRARASEKPDTNQTHQNRKDHTSYGPTGGNQTTTRTLGRREDHPRPGPTTTSHHN